ncbi:MAG TPA: helix-turn-helix domain-containing protein, partial [Desulfobaccales bacterium]
QTLTAGDGKDVFDSFMDRFASLLISEALDLTGGNRSRAAKILGISRPTLLSKIEKYRLKLETSVKLEGP